MPDATRFEIFAFWRTSATYRVRVALNLKGLEANERFVNLDAGEQRGADFLAVNPMGAIPALIDTAPGAPRAPITQSLAILEFLDEIQPAPPLLPAGPHDRARARSLAAMLAGDTHPLITQRIKSYLTSEGRFSDSDWRAWQIHWFSTGLRAFEQRLAAEEMTGRFCHGDSVTMADICLASIIVVTRLFKIEISDIPTIDRIMGECERLPAFARAAPLSQRGAPTP
jgi:maleylacetoacetate isomerase/maleylpyruvate isomerase